MKITCLEAYVHFSSTSHQGLRMTPCDAAGAKRLMIEREGDMLLVKYVGKDSDVPVRVTVFNFAHVKEITCDYCEG